MDILRDSKNKSAPGADVFDPAFDLKQSLVQDPSGRSLEAVCTALREGHLILNKAMATGLTQKEYQLALGLKDALNAAEDSVNNYWRIQNPTS
jgi:hypothetical protein